MPNVLSPQVITREIDISFVAPAISGTIVGIAGGTSKGPVNKRTFVTTPAEYIDTFGPPDPRSYLGYTAINFLQQGNQLWVVRAASNNGTDPIAVANTDTGAQITSVNLTSLTATQRAGSVSFKFDNDPAKVVNVTFTSLTAASISSMVTVLNNAFSTGFSPRLAVAAETGVAGAVGTGFITITTQSKLGPISRVQTTADTTGSSIFGIQSGVGARTIQVEQALTAASLNALVAAATYNTQTVDAAITSSNSGPYAIKTKATGNVAFSGTAIANNDTFTATVNGNSVTVTASGMTGTYATDEATMIAALANAINSDATVSSLVVASPNTGAHRVDLSAVQAGTVGNSITLAASYTAANAALTASGANLSGGTQATTLVFKIDGTTYSVDFNVNGTFSNITAATAQEVCDAINGVVGALVATVSSGAVKIASPSLGEEGSVQVTGANTVIGLATQTVTGTGDRHFQFRVDSTYTVDVYFTSSASLSAAQVVQEINAASTLVSSNLANVASLDNLGTTFALTSPTVGTTPFGSKLEILNRFNPNGVMVFNTTQSAVGTGSVVYAIRVEAKTPGTWANNSLKVRFTDEDPRFFAPNSSRVDVFVGSNLVETYRECVVNPLADGSKGPNGQGTFIETAINTVSNLIVIDFDESLVGIDFTLDPPDQVTGVKIRPNTSTAGVLPPYIAVGGADGITGLGDAEIIGVQGDSPTGLQQFANTEELFLNIVAAPGYTSQAVGDALITLAETRGDLLAIIDPPIGLKPSEVIDWHNGAGNHGRAAAFNTSYGALYGTWLSATDSFNNVEVILPPSTFTLAQMAINDRLAEPWFAPAGLTRGKIRGALDVQFNPTVGTREAMYGNGNAVNPIVNFAQDGIVIWGQRTLQRQPSALDRINVRRMLNIAKTLVGLAAKVILFEPNDAATRGRLAGLINPILNEIKVKRGIARFQVVDVTTDRDISLNRISMRVFLQPTQSAEVIDIPFVITAVGASFTV